MSENLQTLLKEALLNNSYDYDPMHNTIKNTWMNSFSYLYTLQKSYIEYEELFYFSNDEISRNSKLIGKLYLDKKIYANFDIDYDLIHVYTREEFRLSDYYNNTFTIDDMVYNPDIFFKIPIVIIDDQVIWDYKIRVKKECTTFILPFRRKFVIKNERNPVTDDIIYVDHKIQVLVVDNIFYQRYKMNKSSLYFNTTTKTLKINKKRMEEMTLQELNTSVKKEFMNKWKLKYPSELTPTQEDKIKKEIKRRYKAVKVPKQDGVMMCSLHFPSNAGKAYELGTALIPFEDNGDDYYIAYLTDDIVHMMSEHNMDLYISIVFLNRLYQHTFYTGDKTTTSTEYGADLMVIQSSEMEPYKTPIPVENFMVFKKKSDERGFILEKNTEMLDMHYPNIYRIKDDTLEAGDIYKIYYFYHNAYDLQYTVLFDFYFKFLTNVFTGQKIEKIINDIYYGREDLSGYTEEQKSTFKNIFDKILAYKYFNHQYGESDFLNRYLLLDGNSDKTPIEYKDETLKQWIRVQPWVLRDYVLEQHKLGASYHLYTNTLDLSTRLRTNTQLELDSPSKEFDEPRYVFAFANERDYPTLLDCRVFVDGLLAGDVYHERRLFMDYFYIPASMVTEDSYIELEIFPTYTFEKEVMFTSLEDTEEITIIEPDETIFPTVADLYFIDANNEYQRFTPNLFKILCHYKRGDFYFESIEDDDGNVTISLELKSMENDTDYENKDGELICNIERTPDEYGQYSIFDDPIYYSLEGKCIEDKSKLVRFTRLNNFTIQPKSKDMLNIPLKLKFTKCPKTIRFIVDKAGFAYIGIAEPNFNFSTEYLRIFRNGRLMPRNKYRLLTTSGRVKLIFLEWLDIGDIIYVDITPYRYTEIHYQQFIGEEDNIRINLNSVINKPFDIRYYDVYLNGRKLSTNNVFAISPWEIALVNLKSKYNLVIYEKERDWEYFGLDYTENIYYFSIHDLFNSGIVTDDMRDKMVNDIIDKIKDDRLNIYPNTNDEEIMDFSDEDRIYATFNIFYNYELIPKTFVNPDVLQFSSVTMRDAYIDIYDNYLRSPYSEAGTIAERIRRVNYPKVICLDPDTYIESVVGDVTFSMMLKDKVPDTDYIDENGNMVCDAERVPDEEGKYNEVDNPLVYNMDNNLIDGEEVTYGTKLLVYEVGHSDEVSQEFLDQHIEIPSDGNID